MTSRPCDYCKLATAAMYCHADAAFLCAGCDENVHAATARHVRVPLCEVCEQAPAHVTCKADAAVLCATCDRDIHSANPLARRHERHPVVPLPDCYPTTDNRRRFSDVEEAEAASWLLPDPNAGKSGDENLNNGQYVFSGMDPYLDLEYSSVDTKKEAAAESSGTDGVVPEQSKLMQTTPFVNDNCFDFDFSASKTYHGGYSCISQTVSSSSPDVGVVPDGGSTAEISNPYSKIIGKGTETVNLIAAVQLSSAEREARVLRYREKRKNRKFEKTIRYASRKAYAEKRPRIKGRFAKRTESGSAGAGGGGGSFYGGYDVVPSF